MRLEYKVFEVAGVWRVQRGLTGALTYADFDAALRAAETLAGAAAASGEKGVVTILREGCAPEVRTYPPERPRSPPRVAYNPELDWRNLGAAGRGEAYGAAPY